MKWFAVKYVGVFFNSMDSIWLLMLCICCAVLVIVLSFVCLRRIYIYTLHPSSTMYFVGVFLFSTWNILLSNFAGKYQVLNENCRQRNQRRQQHSVFICKFDAATYACVCVYVFVHFAFAHTIPILFRIELLWIGKGKTKYQKEVATKQKYDGTLRQSNA